jgi:hypothetical protein
MFNIREAHWQAVIQDKATLANENRVNRQRQPLFFLNFIFLSTL